MHSAGGQSSTKNSLAAATVAVKLSIEKQVASTDSVLTALLPTLAFHFTVSTRVWERQRPSCSAHLCGTLRSRDRCWRGLPSCSSACPSVVGYRLTSLQALSDRSVG